MFFKSYLHQVDRSSVCGEGFGQIHADDGPAWLTIGMVGHVVVPMALFIETNCQWPHLVSMTVWPLTASALTMTILPTVAFFGPSRRAGRTPTRHPSAISAP